MISLVLTYFNLHLLIYNQFLIYVDHRYFLCADFLSRDKLIQFLATAQVYLYGGCEYIIMQDKNYNVTKYCIKQETKSPIVPSVFCYLTYKHDLFLDIITNPKL